MSDIFFLVVGIILFGIGLLLLAAKVMTYIKCTVPINATVVKLETESTFFRGVEHTHYRPVVRYVVDGKSYTEEAYFRTRRKTKYPVDSEMIMYTFKKVCASCGKEQPGSSNHHALSGTYHGSFTCVYCHKTQQFEIETNSN